MLQINQLKIPIRKNEKKSENEILWKEIPEILNVNKEDIADYKIIKKSIDARKKPDLYWIYSIAVQLSKRTKELLILQKKKNPNVTEYRDIRYDDSIFKNRSTIFNGKEIEQQPIIIGTGPAGLFCGYFLAMAGLKPILIERGECVENRIKTVEEFWNGKELMPNSNIQFGEGGAGTFSDGKLQTQVKDKTGRIRKVLEIFVEHGAPDEILYLNKPHIGTDILAGVIKNMRIHMQKMGAEFLFNTCMIGIRQTNGKISGIMVETAEKKETIPTNCCILAIGHSARDTFHMLKTAGVSMENKPFAVGLRVQHNQDMINLSQYGAGWEEKGLPAADYKLTGKANSGRGIYSFCMCPGGYVVNSSSEPGRIAVNGMSYHGRNSENANSAIVMNVNENDYGTELFDGLHFQQELERLAYEASGNGKLTLQRLEDYRKESEEHSGVYSFDDTVKTVMPQVKGQFEWGDLRKILPRNMYRDFLDGMDYFGNIIRGFDRGDTILCGIESRTSSPVRIIRDDSFQSNLSGLFPCGEGAGYAGGITSAAVDGLKVAEKVVLMYD